MPSPKRWFPKSRDINRDPQYRELRRKFGASGMAIFDEVFALLDVGDNRLDIEDELVRSIASSCMSTPSRCTTTLAFMVEKHWLRIVAAIPEEGQPYSYYEARNYWKYHRKREEKGASLAPYKGDIKEPSLSQPNPLPSLPYPILPNKEKEKNIYILISDFVLSQDFKERAVSEHLPNPEANLANFVEYREDKGQQFTQGQWESLYLTQLRYLVKHPEARVDAPKTFNNASHCTFESKTSDQFTEFGTQPCLAPICQASQKYCTRHFEYYRDLVTHLTRERN